jgi:hypothetical protein
MHSCTVVENVFIYLLFLTVFAKVLFGDAQFSSVNICIRLCKYHHCLTPHQGNQILNIIVDLKCKLLGLSSEFQHSHSHSHFKNLFNCGKTDVIYNLPSLLF